MELQSIHNYLTIQPIAHSPPGAHSHEDVTGTVTMMTEVMARLSLQKIEGLWAGIEQELPVDIKEHGHQTLLDLLPICATMMQSALILSLSNLVHKACIDPSSSVYDYPVKTYG